MQHVNSDSTLFCRFIHRAHTAATSNRSIMTETFGVNILWPVWMVNLSTTFCCYHFFVAAIFCGRHWPPKVFRVKEPYVTLKGKATVEKLDLCSLWLTLLWFCDWHRAISGGMGLPWELIPRRAPSRFHSNVLMHPSDPTTDCDTVTSNQLHTKMRIATWTWKRNNLLKVVSKFFSDLFWNRRATWFQWNFGKW